MRIELTPAFDRPYLAGTSSEPISSFIPGRFNSFGQVRLLLGLLCVPAVVRIISVFHKPLLVHLARLELAWITPSDSHSDAAANYATGA